MSSEFVPIQTVAEVRTALRDTIFMINFQVSAAKFSGEPGDDALFRDLVCNFITFGVVNKIIPPDEGNEWLDMVWGRKTQQEVVEKYEHEHYTGDPGNDSPAIETLGSAKVG